MYSLSERDAGLVTNLSNICNMKIIQFYTPTSTNNDTDIYKFYEDVEVALEFNKTRYASIIGDINTKVWKKSVGMTELGHFGIDNQNDRGDLLVGFAAKKNLRIMNTFFDRKASMEKSEQ